MSYILIADDDLAIAELIADSLEDEGYTTQIVTHGKEVLARVQTDTEAIDLILLDIMMPDQDGLSICKQIRRQVDAPIIFVSAKATNQNKIEGLEIGADDYIAKPFSVEELVARVNAHMRREQRRLHPDAPVINLGEVIIHKTTQTVTYLNQAIELSTREYQVLLYLAENAGKTLSREQIFENVWHTSYGDLNSVTVHIKNIRSKLDPNNELIRTVWGVGYRLVRRNGLCH